MTKISSLTAFLLASAVGLAVWLPANSQAPEAEPAAEAEPEMTDEEIMRHVSYATGYNLGKQYKSSSMKMDLELLINGVNAGQSGQPSELDDEEVRKAYGIYMNRLREEAKAERERVKAERLSAGRAFLEANKAKRDVVETDSGLQYRVLARGTGAIPTEADKVSVHYEGRLLDGSVFDSSYARGEPSSFGVSSVIRGWTEGLQLMPVGSIWELYVPAELAYGPSGTRKIPAFSTLVFRIELLEIE